MAWTPAGPGDGVSSHAPPRLQGSVTPVATQQQHPGARPVSSTAPATYRNAHRGTESPSPLRDPGLTAASSSHGDRGETHHHDPPPHAYRGRKEVEATDRSNDTRRRDSHVVSMGYYQQQHQPTDNRRVQQHDDTDDSIPLPPPVARPKQSTSASAASVSSRQVAAFHPMVVEQQRHQQQPPAARRRQEETEVEPLDEQTEEDRARMRRTAMWIEETAPRTVKEGQRQQRLLHMDPPVVDQFSYQHRAHSLSPSGRSQRSKSGSRRDNNSPKKERKNKPEAAASKPHVTEHTATSHKPTAQRQEEQQVGPSPAQKDNDTSAYAPPPPLRRRNLPLTGAEKPTDPGPKDSQKNRTSHQEGDGPIAPELRTHAHDDPHLPPSENLTKVEEAPEDPLVPLTRVPTEQQHQPGTAQYVATNTTAATTPRSLEGVSHNAGTATANEATPMTSSSGSKPPILKPSAEGGSQQQDSLSRTGNYSTATAECITPNGSTTSTAAPQLATRNNSSVMGGGGGTDHSQHPLAASSSGGGGGQRTRSNIWLRLAMVDQFSQTEKENNEDQQVEPETKVVEAKPSGSGTDDDDGEGDGENLTDEEIDQLLEQVRTLQEALELYKAEAASEKKKRRSAEEQLRHLLLTKHKNPGAKNGQRTNGSVAETGDGDKAGGKQGGGGGDTVSNSSSALVTPRPNRVPGSDTSVARNGGSEEKRAHGASPASTAPSTTTAADMPELKKAKIRIEMLEHENKILRERMQQLQQQQRQQRGDGGAGSQQA